MRHYECIDGSSRKFWEINLSGASVSVRYGRLGTRGQRKTWQFATPDEAKRDWEKRIAQKTRRGYQLTFVEGSDLEDAEDIELVRNHELEAAVRSDPNSDEAILVYGDWLAEQDDPRGHLILTYRRMHEETDPTKFIELKNHAQSILAQYPGAFYGRFLEYTDRVRIRWRLGFFDDVRVHRRTDEPRTHQTLAALFDAPAAFLLRTLIIDDFDREACAALAAAAPPTLQALSIYMHPDDDERPVTNADVLAACAVLPNLVRLSVSQPVSGDALIATLAEMPLAKKLRHFGLEWSDIDETTAGLLAVKFPALRSVSLDQCNLDDSFRERLVEVIRSRGS